MQFRLSRLVFVGVALLFVMITAGFAESAPEEQWERTFGGEKDD